VANYYFDSVCTEGAPASAGAIGSNAASPAKLGVSVNDWSTSSYFWVGFILGEEGCNKQVTTSTTINLRVQKDSGGWTDYSCSI
jgi:hypothetical protein